MSDTTLLLGVDTSRDGDLVLAELSSLGKLTQLARQQFSSREQSAELLPRLTRLLETAQISLGQLSAIVVVKGPGSFTGLRIGLAAVKGIAHATKLPVIAVSSLAVLASLDPQATAAVLIAGRAECYVRTAGEDGNAVESLLLETDLRAIVGDKCVVVADVAVAGKLPRSTAVNPSAFDAIHAALPRFHGGDFEDIATLDANYVRRPYTERAPGALHANEPAASR